MQKVFCLWLVVVWSANSFHGISRIPPHIYASTKEWDNDVTDSDFKKNIAELRKSIYLGNVSEGVAQIVEMLHASRNDEERRELLLELVLLSLACNDLEEAKERWDEVCDCKGSPDVRMRGYRAFFELMRGRKKHAFSEFKKVIEEDPSSFEFHLLRGLAYIQTNQFEYAQADLVRASSLFPENVLVMSILADVNVELNNIESAMAMHEKVLTASPDFRRSLMSLGVIYFEQDRHEDAFRLFQCLVAYDPVNWFAWACLGDIRIIEKGKTLQALPYYAAAVITGCEISNIYLNLAKGLMMLGRFDNAVRVIELYEKNTEQTWEGEDIMIAQYLTLIADIIKSPNLIQTPEFHARFERLAPCHDEAGICLFNLLATVASISYQDDISIIYSKHLYCFVMLAQYLGICSERMIYPEETILFCTIARMFIWHGMLFEARAVLGLLEHAEEPRIQDMKDIILNEMYKFVEVEDRAYMNLEFFHFKVIHTSGIDGIIDRILAGEFIAPPEKGQWMQYLEDAMLDIHNSELHRTFVNPPILEAFKQFETALNAAEASAEAQFETISEFWFDFDIWKTGFDMDKHRKSFEQIWQSATQQFMSDSSVWPYIKNLAEHFIQQPDVTEEKQPQIVDHFAEALKLIVQPDKRQNANIEIFAANSDITQVCAATPDEALGGFTPLPFAIDGTAFSRFMKPVKLKTERLNDLNYAHYLKSWVHPCLNFCTKYLLTHCSETKKEKQQKEFQKSIKQFERFLASLHGQKKFRESMFNAMPKMTADLIELVMPESSLLQQFQTMAEEAEFPVDGLQFPKIPLYASSILVGKEVFPEFLKDTDILERPISCNFITCKNLEEFFYNHAVTRIENWFETKDNTLLMPFLDNTMKPFIKFQNLHDINHSCMDLHIHKTIDNAQQVLHMRSLIHHQKTRKDAYQDALIYSPEEMAESLENYCDWCQSCTLPAFDIGFETGSKLHIFIKQFNFWAHEQAVKLYPEISNIEAEVRSVTPATLYLVTWRIRELIKRFPWLSRLYVLLASAYARVEQYDNALKAIEHGLPHEHLLYKNTGWYAVTSSDAENEQKLDAVESLNELEESQLLLWSERYVFQPRDEAMYHYAAYRTGYEFRKRRKLNSPAMIHRICRHDKSGAFDFYQLFKRFLPRVANLRDAYCSALAVDNIVTLRDFMVHVLTQMIAPETFPLRRQIAELLFELYPEENTGALGRFYCDNMQPANALPMASYAYLAECSDEMDDETQSTVTIGCLLYDMGYMDHAMTFLEKAIRVKNPSPMAFLTLGCALIENRELDRAIECLKAGQVLDPSSDRFHYNMALAYIEQGKLDDAERSIKAGILLAKYPVDLNLQLMRIYVRKNKFVEALPLAKYVASEDPEMFVMALRFAEFDEFVKLKPVQNLILDCHYNPDAF